MTDAEARAFKDGQRANWDGASSGWNEWWEIIEAGSRDVTERIFELAEVEADDRLLDVATGLGEPAITAAAKVGVGGYVVATDLSYDMLEFARERIRNMELTNIEFIEADIEEIGDVLPGKDEFDKVLCRWGLMFLPHLDRGLHNIMRLLKSGGRLGFSTWSVPERVPFASIAMGVLSRELKLNKPKGGYPGIFALSTKDVITKHLRHAGFTGIEVEPVDATLTLSSLDEFIRFTAEVAAPITALIVKEPPERQVELWDKIKEGFAGFVREDGSVHVVSEALVGVGVK